MHFGKRTIYLFPTLNFVLSFEEQVRYLFKLTHITQPENTRNITLKFYNWVSTLYDDSIHNHFWVFAVKILWRQEVLLLHRAERYSLVRAYVWGLAKKLRNKTDNDVLQ